MLSYRKRERLLPISKNQSILKIVEAKNKERAMQGGGKGGRKTRMLVRSDLWSQNLTTLVNSKKLTFGYSNMKPKWLGRVWIEHR